MGEGRIELAHMPDLELGGLHVRPSTREIARDGQAPQVLEPRVMQVLVALGRSPGTMLTREDLTRDCWEGRIVGEDAINRVLSRLRRVAEGIGKDCFRIETVTKVGYRLVVLAGSIAEQQPTAVAARPTQPSHEVTRMPVDRRLIIAGGVLALLGIGAGSHILSGSSSASQMAAPSPEAAALMGQANHALDQNTREGQNQAFGLYRRVVAINPDYADGWGALAFAYATVAPFRRSSEGYALRARAVQAAQRAIAIERENPRGRAALALVRPRLGGWLAIERALRAALATKPDDPALLTALTSTLAAVGRASAGLLLQQRAAQLSADPTPGLYYVMTMALWASGRLEEADRMISEAVGVFPTHLSLWFARFYILMYSGRAAEAVALGENLDGRPTGIPTREFEAIIRVARAIETPEPAAIDSVITEQMDWARKGAGYAENSIQFASALGRLDQAFIFADAYYFGRRFEVPEIRFSREQGTYTPRRERLTNFLFLPSTSAMRIDPRFAKLTQQTGLASYWAQSASTPDYRKGT